MQNNSAAQGAGRRLTTWFADEFRPAVLANSLLNGALTYVLEIIVVLSFAALIFSGELANQMPRALGFIILGDTVLVVVISLLSSYPSTILGLLILLILARFRHPLAFPLLLVIAILLFYISAGEPEPTLPETDSLIVELKAIAREHENVERLLPYLQRMNTKQARY